MPTIRKKQLSTKPWDQLRYSSSHPMLTGFWSHVIYQMKINNSLMFRLTSRIAPHENGDSQKDGLKSDCFVCSPRALAFFSQSIRFPDGLWENSMLRTTCRKPFRPIKIFRLLPLASVQRFLTHGYWLTTAYGLVYGNDKFQANSDKLRFDIGLSQLAYLRQLFYQRNDRKLALSVI